MTVTPSHFDTLWKLMDAAQLRHQVVSQNIANVNTPGYKTLRVSFEEQLAAQLSHGRSSNIGEVPTEILTDLDSPSRADGNNVNIDNEMGRLSKNTLLFSTYSQVLASKLGMMQRAING